LSLGTTAVALVAGVATEGGAAGDEGSDAGDGGSDAVSGAGFAGGSGGEGGSGGPGCASAKLDVKLTASSNDPDRGTRMAATIARDPRSRN
jgi:hypothetical protein